MLLHLKSVLSRFTSLDQRPSPLLILAEADVTGRFYADTPDNLLCFTSNVFPSLDYQPTIMRCLGTPPGSSRNVADNGAYGLRLDSDK